MGCRTGWDDVGMERDVNAYGAMLCCDLCVWAVRYRFVSNASPFVNGTNVMAYDSQFIGLNMTQLFGLPAPPTKGHTDDDYLPPAAPILASE